MSAIDDYLHGLAPDQKAALARVRETVAALVPDAEEGGPEAIIIGLAEQLS